MENNFEHARAFAHDYLVKIGQDLNQSSMVRIMTEWAANFSSGEVKAVINDAGKALEADLRAKIAELEDKLVSQEHAHQEALITLQTQIATKEVTITDSPEVEVKTSKKKATNG